MTERVSFSNRDATFNRKFKLVDPPATSPRRAAVEKRSSQDPPRRRVKKEATNAPRGGRAPRMAVDLTGDEENKDPSEGELDENGEEVVDGKWEWDCCGCGGG